MVRLLAWLIAFAVIGGCGSKLEPSAEERSDREYDFADYRAFVEGIAKAGSVAVFEGLPSDFDEPELYASEIAKKIHVSIDGFEFYKGAEKLTELQAAVMNGQLRAAATPYVGPKECGGFHPDYMAEWTVETDKYRAHFCFGCDEIKLVGPGIDTLVDITAAKVDAVEEALLKFRDKRPGAR